MLNKSRCESLHFRNRAIQRYNLLLNHLDRRLIIKKIQNQEGYFIEKISNRVSDWMIFYKDKWLLVGYDKLRYNLITTLPYEKRNDQC